MPCGDVYLPTYPRHTFQPRYLVTTTTLYTPGAVCQDVRRNPHISSLLQYNNPQRNATQRNAAQVYKHEHPERTPRRINMSPDHHDDTTPPTNTLLQACVCVCASLAPVWLTREIGGVSVCVQVHQLRLFKA